MTAEVLLHDFHPTTVDLHAKVLAGLRGRKKMLPCMLFYDDTGSQLFDRICELDEYALEVLPKGPMAKAINNQGQR